jgi:hypothetical protein
VILPGVGSMMAGLSKSAPEIRGSVQVAANSTWATGDWAPDIAAHEAGDLLVVIIAAHHSQGLNFDISSGWTSVVYPTVSGTTGLRILKRVAVSDYTTLTLTNNKVSGETAKAAVHSYACSFAYGDVDSDYVTGSRNPPSLTPDWGSENNLWIAANVTLDTAPTDPPTDFGNAVQTGGACDLSTADRSIETPTLDPSAFEGSAGSTDITVTLAVRPA